MTRIYNALQRYQERLDKVSIASTVRRLIATRLPRDTLVMLYSAIEQRLAPDAPRIVQIASATEGEGASTIARDLAVTVADVIGRRVLLINVIGKELPQIAHIPSMTPVGLEAVIGGIADEQDVIEAVPGLPLYETTLNLVGASGKHLFDVPALERVLRSALAKVDLVVIDAPPLLRDFAGLALARHCGGTVLVIEAEKVRAPKVVEARRLVEAHGGRVIGAVLNKRRWHIPRFVYRHLP
jgi:Mrp family chromosome partitioning ATPase